MVEEQLTAATLGGHREKGGRSCSRGGGAANRNDLGGLWEELLQGVEEQLTAAALGGLREEKQELLQGWRKS